MAGLVTRVRTLLVHALAGACLAAPLACFHVGHVGQVEQVEPSRSEHAVAGMVLECPVGAAGCPCTAGGACDAGLTCVSGTCSYANDYRFEDEESNGYEYERDLAPPAPSYDSEISISAGTSMSKPKFGRNRMDKAERRAVSKTAAAEAPAPPGMAEPAGDAMAGGEIDGREPGMAPTLDPAAQRRQVIYTATLSVAVYELDAAIAHAEALPERWGGWIESRYDYQITLRIPAERLFEAITELSELGMVLDKTLRADDVTGEYVDLEARILVLEQMVARLEQLLALATSVEQALEIRVELDRVRIELESARARMRQLAELIDFSTLTLYLSGRGPDQLPSSNDPFPWVDELGAELTEYR